MGAGVSDAFFSCLILAFNPLEEPTRKLLWRHRMEIFIQPYFWSVGWTCGGRSPPTSLLKFIIHGCEFLGCTEAHTVYLQNLWFRLYNSSWCLHFGSLSFWSLHLGRLHRRLDNGRQRRRNLRNRRSWTRLKPLFPICRKRSDCCRQIRYSLEQDRFDVRRVGFIELTQCLSDRQPRGTARRIQSRRNRKRRLSTNTGPYRTRDHQNGVVTDPRRALRIKKFTDGGKRHLWIRRESLERTNQFLNGTKSEVYLHIINSDRTS